MQGAQAGTASGLLAIGGGLLANGLGGGAGNAPPGFGASFDGQNPEQQPNTARRGDYVPYLLGRARLPAVILGVWDPDTNEESVGGGGGGKGGGGGGGGAPAPSIVTYEEKAWHAICVGPAHAIHRVFVNGRNVLDTDDDAINSASDPSGTEIDSKAGDFRVFWGHKGQNISVALQQHEEAFDGEIQSRWEGFLGTVWDSLDLGQQRTHPNVEYDVEVRPFWVGLSKSSPWVKEKYALNGLEHTIIGTFVDADGAQGFSVSGNQKKHYKKTGQVVIEDNPAAGTYHVRKAKYKPSLNITRVTLEEDAFGLVVQGIAKPKVKSKVGGVNPAHAIYQMLFAPWPWGMGRDIEDFDITSLEELGVFFGDDGPEPTPAKVLGRNGVEFRDMIAQLMLDLGIFITFANGRWAFKPVRKVLKPVPSLPKHAILNPLPTRGKYHGERKRGKVLFEYDNWKKKFRTSNANEADDSVTTERGRGDAVTERMMVPIDKVTATRIAHRRGQELLGDGFTTTIMANHEARDFYPGMTFEAPDYFKQLLLVISVKRDPLTSRVELGCVANYYGVEVDEEPDEDDDDDPILDVGDEDEDKQTVSLQWPPFLPPPNPLSVKKLFLFARARGGPGSPPTLWWVSKNLGNWKKLGKDAHKVPFGTLTEAVAADGPSIVETGPVFTGLGPDVGQIPDFTGDDASWYGGEAVVVMGNEIMFLRSVTFLGNNQYRLNGLIRGRYGTSLDAHSIGDTFYVIVDGKVFLSDHKFFKPGETVYVASTPQGLTVDEVDPLEITVAQQCKPLAPVNLRMADPYRGRRDLYDATGTVDPYVFSWGYYNHPKETTGCGTFPAGSANVPDDPKGSFKLEIWDSTGTDLKRTVEELTSPTYSYTYANLESDFGGSTPTAFMVKVVHRIGGLDSDAASVVFTDGDTV